MCGVFWKLVGGSVVRAVDKATAQQGVGLTCSSPERRGRDTWRLGGSSRQKIRGGGRPVAATAGKSPALPCGFEFRPLVFRKYKRRYDFMVSRISPPTFEVRGEILHNLLILEKRYVHRNFKTCRKSIIESRYL